MKGMWAGVGAMVQNDGSCMNEKRFWDTFVKFFGQKCLDDYEVFDEFYSKEYALSKNACGFQPKSAEIVKWLKEKGIRVVLATNPLFPQVATYSRVRWAGLAPEDFEFITTYENFGYSKPNPAYYAEILRQLNMKPEESLMVGNDVDEDLSSLKVGMSAFLLTDCMINKHNKDLSDYAHGNFDELKKYLESEIQ